MRTPAGKTPETGASPAAGWMDSCRNPPGRERFLARELKEMSGPPKSCWQRMRLTNVGSPKGREPYGDRVPVVVAGATTCQGGREGRPQGEAAPSNSVLDRSLREQRFGRRYLWATRLTWTRKREGTAAWRESTERREGVEGAAVPGPRDMAKTRLFEAQSPAMEMCILRLTTPGAEPSASGESPLLRPNPSGWWAVDSEFT